MNSSQLPVTIAPRPNILFWFVQVPRHTYTHRHTQYTQEKFFKYYKRYSCLCLFLKFDSHPAPSIRIPFTLMVSVEPALAWHGELLKTQIQSSPRKPAFQEFSETDSVLMGYCLPLKTLVITGQLDAVLKHCQFCNRNSKNITWIFKQNFYFFLLLALYLL